MNGEVLGRMQSFLEVVSVFCLKGARGAEATHITMILNIGLNA